MRSVMSPVHREKIRTQSLQVRRQKNVQASQQNKKIDNKLRRI